LAKVNEGYLNIIAGSATDVLSDFTNYPSEIIEFDDKTMKTYGNQF